MKFIKNKICNYLQILNEDKGNIKDQINVISINRALVFNIFNIFFQICNLFFYSDSDYLFIYHILSVSAILFSIIIIIYILKLEQEEETQSLFYIKISKFLRLYHIALVIFFIVIVTADFTINESILNYLIYCFVLAFCAPYLIQKYLLFVLPITFYALGLSIYLGLNISSILYIIVFSISSIITSQLLYLSRYSYLKTIDKLTKENHNLYKNLEYDKLTKIFNRYGHNNRLEDLFPKIVNKQRVIAVFMMDIDYFKKINDTEGHQQGDAILSKIAMTISDLVKSKLNKVEFISRYGGEEFFAMATDVTYNEVKEISEAFRSSIENLKIDRKYKRISPYVTISVGASIGTIKGRKDLQNLIFNSDEALYESKQHGRNRYTIYKFNNGDIK